MNSVCVKCKLWCTLSVIANASRPGKRSSMSANVASAKINDNDVESGTIYVLRSKSTRPEIAAIKDLYKIGFTVTSVESRIANAKNGL